MDDLTKKVYNYVLQRYFGDMSDPVAAAIDRAYSDMVSYIQEDFQDEYEKKVECRLNASDVICSALKKIDDNYDEWHKNLCNGIIEQYKCDNQEVSLLSYDQAQKWVNMTMKYLWVFYLIFKDMGVSPEDGFPNFFENSNNIKKLHIPLDNYILEYYYENEKSSFE